MHKVLISTAVVLSSKAKAAATVTTGVTAGVTSVALGYDPVAWAIGGLGGAYICLRRAPVPRAHAIADVGLSIVLGGVAAPIVYAVAAEYYPALNKAPGQYVAAIVMCFGWPWMLVIFKKLLIKKLEIPK